MCHLISCFYYFSFSIRCLDEKYETGNTEIAMARKFREKCYLRRNSISTQEFKVNNAVIIAIFYIYKNAQIFKYYLTETGNNKLKVCSPLNL